MKKHLAVVAAVVLQAAVAVWAVFPQLAAFATGTEVRLAAAPVDPMDPFRGAYVQLDYPGLPEKADGSGDYHVPLVRDGDLWKGGTPTRTRPAAPYLNCEAFNEYLDCGLHSYFVSEDRARRLEQNLSTGGLIAVLRVDGQGRAVLTGLEERP
ncbi:GDYXXLXY domain-containing protein [Actinocorallia sp. A-T 12471]|uniref:GDYXXLXY domain-containing protein n=1 Tax=Actinocorallia sp. A-T 12471 TaxID=3089813 RepID=UPI0029D13356|nr:GDYXXLXY domain-containing protein [Actinocorallia sp. A-T 12471]MDX6744250.1 GDYXXLXY domain-containing protein [Actinocorallia sp. A-T 12471]